VRGDIGGGFGRLRGVTLAALTTGLTALGHLVGGGALPDLAMTVVLFPLLACVLTTAARWCTSVAGATLTLAVGQVAMHELLVALHPTHQNIGSAAFATSGMVTMHIVVTLATAVLVRGADEAIEALNSALRRVVPRRLAVPRVAPPLPMLAIPGPAVPARLARARTAPVVRRGPPVRC